MTNPTETKEAHTEETPMPGAGEASARCCGGPPATNASACCVRDEQVKATGGDGCGCGAKPAATTPTAKGCCG